MSSSKTDFLRFNAYSIRDFVTRKLTEDGRFTDQIYTGSNLATLIDLVSYFYQCMLYSLNGAASESMWSDTMFYENISRLSKILGYSPHGIIPSQGTFYIDNRDEETGESGKYQDITVPRYAYFDTGKADSDGNEIYYSTNETFMIDRGSSIVQQQFYNGKWKMFTTIYTATGDDYETFNLEGLGSDIENDKLVADKCIDVYIQSTNDAGEITMTKWELVDDEIFSVNKVSTSDDDNYYGKIYDGTRTVYNIRLDENKEYVLKFGNGIIGKKLNTGDKIYIFYLQTNGTGGALNAGDIDSDGAKLMHSAQAFGLTDQMYKLIFESETEIDDLDIMVHQQYPTTQATEEESVSDIRNNAPIWFKMGHRLVTEEDYRYFLMNVLGNNDLVDCKVQNVWSYTSTFYAWLYNLGKKNHNDSRYYLNQTNLVKNDYQYSDSADSNNIFVWTKLKYGNISNFQKSIEKQLSKIKTLTSEIVFIRPIDVNFAVTAAPESRILQYINNDMSFDALGESYIEVTLDNNSVYVTSEVQTKINKVINDFFNISNMALGATINFRDLMTQLYEINGIKRIRTIYQQKKTADTFEDDSYPIIREGISFATWSDSNVILAGEDLDTSNIMKTLEPFQFPVLYTTELKNKIRVIKKSINNINKITY